ncbi:MAG: sporulation initiation factor Spo0A C-terminal domain-containing protein [Clostridia bacterium]|nr:sporulation initiation factor Spo0A C-terminal domain-containing protein [Clostridia bacterium]
MQTEIQGNRDCQIKNVGMFLTKIGLFSNLKGYSYLISAVQEVVNDPMMMHAITKRLYPKVAVKFNTTPVSVERNIRNAIEIACNKGKFYLVANAYYNANFTKYERPTNGEFIAFLTSVVFLGR